MPSFCEFYPGICLATEEKYGKTSVRVAEEENASIHKEDASIHKENASIHNENASLHKENASIHKENASLHRKMLVYTGKC